MSDEAAYIEGEWTSADGLVLRYRDYRAEGARASERPPLLCIPGLTRNARDFEPLARTFAGGWRILAVDLRGRGQSDYARDPASYTPAQYVEDILALLDSTGVEKVVGVGSSLGGIVVMRLALAAPERLAGAVLNDIGPQVEPEGLARIREQVGQGRTFPTWMHAARALKEQAGAAHPGYAISDWLGHAKRLMCVGAGGRIAFDYDMRIAEPFELPQAGEPADLWPAFLALSGRPVLALRGELSDILSPATLEQMRAELPGLETATIPRTGHVPTLEEPEAQEAIARLLERLA